MKLTLFGKIFIFIFVVGCALGAWRVWQRLHPHVDPGAGAPSGIFERWWSRHAPRGDDLGLLKRPLRVGIVAWPGYAGGIVANNGFTPNRACLYWKEHKLLVEFLLLDDENARAEAFARGGRDGVDLVWSTVDLWGNELPAFLHNGVKARAIMQVDWSRGADAIVVDKRVRRVEDLAKTPIALAPFTPSHWLLEYALAQSSLDDRQQEQIVKGLVGKRTSAEACAAFTAGTVDAAVLRAPDIATALAKRPGATVLLSTATASHCIANLLVAREDFIAAHPDVMQAFVDGWFAGTAAATRDPDAVARLLTANEPRYQQMGEAATRAQLSTVQWAGLAENAAMFGLDGSDALFDPLFRQVSNTWVNRGYLAYMLAPANVRDTTFVQAAYDRARKTAPAVK